MQLTTSRSLGIGTALFGLLAASAPAWAGSTTLLAQTDPNNPSSFALNFVDFGFVTTSAITSTFYELEFDPDAGTARFLDYYQTAEPLILPGDISTGDLQIAILPGSSSGTYDSATGQFTTSEYYEIHFTGDLSAYGLTSPVYLPSTSVGTVSFSDGVRGGITMDWSGNGTLNGPGGPLDFAYVCNVSTIFEADTGCPLDGCAAGDVDRDCDVDLDDLSTLLNSFGARGPEVLRSAGDMNYDGAIDLIDLSNVLAAYGADCN